MMTPIECLELELDNLYIEAGYTKDTEMKRAYNERQEDYRVAIDLLENAPDEEDTRVY